MPFFGTNYSYKFGYEIQLKGKAFHLQSVVKNVVKTTLPFWITIILNSLYILGISMPIVKGARSKHGGWFSFCTDT